MKRGITLNKKAVSPLVATLLLIAFAVALGFIVMNWGNSYIEEKAEFTVGPKDVSSCNLVELSIIKVGGMEKICYNPADYSIEVFLENGPEIRIDDLQVRIIGSSGIFSLDSVLDMPLERATARQVKFSYSPEIGGIQQVKLIPKVGLREPLFCTKKAVVSEDIQQC